MLYQYPALLFSQNHCTSSQLHSESSQSSSTASQVVPKPSQLPRTISNSFQGTSEVFASPSSTQHSFLAKIAPEDLEIVVNCSRDFNSASRTCTQSHNSVSTRIFVSSPLSQPSLSSQAIPKLSSTFEPRNSANQILIPPHCRLYPIPPIPVLDLAKRPLQAQRASFHLSLYLKVPQTFSLVDSLSLKPRNVLLRPETT